MKNKILPALGFFILHSTLCFSTHAQGTAFTYQGRLNNNGSPANGSYDFRFKLYADSLGNTQVSASYLTNAIPVTNGLFITPIDFGAGIFTGSNYWLEVDVKTNNAGSYTVLSPLQAVTPTPYAVFANTASNLSGTLPTAQLTGTIPASQLSGTPTAAVNFTGTLNGDVTGSQTATVISSVGGQSAANIASGAVAANTATSATTANMIVKRDTSGNFSAGTITATAFSGGGTITWQTISGTSQQAQPNTGYIVNNAAQVTITLPTSPNVGDVVRVSGVGTGGWKIAQNSNQFILVGNVAALNVGTSWTSHGPSTNWDCLASSADGTKLVAGVAGGQLYTSADSGTTWTPHGPSANWGGVASSADGTKLVAGIVGGQIYTSADSGTTWTTHGASSNWLAIASSADGTKLVAGLNPGQIYTSADSGTTWTAHGPWTNWLAAASSTDGTKLVATVIAGQIYTSADSGVTWTPHGSSVNWKRNGVASSADGTKLVAGNTAGQIYTSGDSGMTWTQHGVSADALSVASSADGTKLLAADNGGQIYTSADSGNTWSQPQGITKYWYASASSADGSKLVVVDTSPGQIYTSTPALASPGNTTSVGTGGFLTGGQGASIELQYIGNNEFTVVNHEGTIFAY